MTEAEWLAETDPTTLLDFLPGKASERKKLLLVLACWRRIEHLLPNEACRDVLTAMEMHIERQFTAEELRATRYKANVRHEEDISQASKYALAAVVMRRHSYESVEDMMPDSIEDTLASIAEATAWVNEGTEDAISEPEEREQCLLIRDISESPFHRTTLEPTWLTFKVLNLAERIYSEHAFDRMPILADALQEAGCDNDAILTHCRSDGPHVKGCWVVDLILGKS